MSAHPRDDSHAARHIASLRRRAETLYPLRDARLTIPGAAQPYLIALPANPDEPLDRFTVTLPPQSESEPSHTSAEARSSAQEAARMVAAGVHMPYWATLWASGQALAEALLLARGDMTGWSTLELGCGLGVTATAALERGLSLLAADCFTEALLFCRYNTLRNAGRACPTIALDWRTPAGRAACLARGPFDLLLAADVLYEEEDIAPLLDLAPRLLAPGARFWLAEPGRRASQAFVAAALARGWTDEPAVYERDWPELGVARVTVHRFLPSEQDIL